MIDVHVKCSRCGEMFEGGGSIAQALHAIALMKEE